MRKKHSIYLSVLLSLAMIFVSCDEQLDNAVDNSANTTENNSGPGFDIPTTEQKGKSTITYQFSKNVSLLSANAQKNYLVKVEKDSILFFLPETPDSIMPKVGKILSSRISDKLPYGLGNKVISKTEEKGLIKFVTSVAPLNEVFEEFHLNSEFSIEDFFPQSNPITDDNGNTYNISVKDINEVFPSKAWTRAEFGSDKVLEIPIKKSSVEDGFGFDTESSLIFGVIFKYEADDNGTYEYSIKPSISVVGKIGGKFTKEQSKDITKGTTKALLEFFSKKSLVNMAVQVGPVTLRPFLDLSAAFVGKIEGEYSCGIEYQAGCKIGYNNQEGFFCKNTSDDLDIFKLFKNVDLIGKVQVGPEIDIAAGIGLYTRNLAVKLNVKPSLLFGAELGMGVDDNSNKFVVKDQNLTLDLSASASGAICADLIFAKVGKETPEATINFYNKTWPIFPELDRSRFEFKTFKDKPLRVNISYYCKEGAFMKLFGGLPGIKIKKGETEVFSTESNLGKTGSNFVAETTQYMFPCIDMEPGEKYFACPTVRFWRTGITYEWPGEEFTAGDSFIRVQMCPDENHPHIIDLGLPSGTKWSCCNVGASEPAALGKYFAYGEITEKDTYTASNYKFNTSLDNFYVNFGAGATGTIAGNAKYDAARAIMGAPWRMPTAAQYKELLENCTVEKKVIHGFEEPILGGNGHMLDAGVWLFTSKLNGKMLMIPGSLYIGSKNNVSSMGTDVFTYLSADGEPWEIKETGKSGFRNPYRIYWGKATPNSETKTLNVYANAPNLMIYKGLPIRPVQ